MTKPISDKAERTAQIGSHALSLCAIRRDSARLGKNNCSFTATRHPVPSENSIRLDSQHEPESSHHPGRCLRSCTCCGSSLSTFSSRDAGCKPNAPLHRAIQRSGTFVAVPVLGGLHHRYAAAVHEERVVSRTADQISALGVKAEVT